MMRKERAMPERDDAQELFIHLTGREDLRGDDDAINEALEDRYGESISFYVFDEIANDLLRYTFPIENPLTGRPMHTLGYQDGPAWTALMRVNATMGGENGEHR